MNYYGGLRLTILNKAISMKIWTHYIYNHALAWGSCVLCADMLSMQSFLWLTCQFEKKEQHFDSFQGYDPLHDLDGNKWLDKKIMDPKCHCMV